MRRLEAEQEKTNGMPAKHGVVVLLYHRVARLDSDPQLLAVTPENFDAQMAFLREHATVLTLTDLVDQLRQGTLPSRGVVVTFDDGYADNLEAAKPILERHAIPATVFVTTSGLEQHREFWWDDLERLLLATPSKLADETVVNIDGVALHLPAGDFCPSPASARWSVLQGESPESRHAAYLAICQAIRPLAARYRSEAVERIEETLRLSRSIRSTHRAMTRSQLRQLDAGGLVEIGAHTLTHPVLAALSPEDQMAEIVESKRLLEETLERPVCSFSYPYGGSRDYSSQTVELVKSAGFTSACANVPGLVTAASDLYQLPRMLVRDWSAEEFARRFESFWSVHESAAARTAR